MLTHRLRRQSNIKTLLGRHPVFVVRWHCIGLLVVNQLATVLLLGQCSRRWPNIKPVLVYWFTDKESLGFPLLWLLHGMGFSHLNTRPNQIINGGIPSV